MMIRTDIVNPDATPIKKGMRVKLGGTWFVIDDIFQTGVILRLVNKGETLAVADGK